MIARRPYTFIEAVDLCNQELRRHLVTIDTALHTEMPEAAFDILQQLEGGESNSTLNAPDYEMLGRLYERLGKSCEGVGHIDFRTSCFARAEKLYENAGKQHRALWVFKNLKFTAYNTTNSYLGRN